MRQASGVSDELALAGHRLSSLKGGRQTSSLRNVDASVGEVALEDANAGPYLR